MGKKSGKSKDFGFASFKGTKVTQRVVDEMVRKELNEKQFCLLNLIRKWNRRQHSSEKLSVKKNRISG